MSVDGYSTHIEGLTWAAAQTTGAIVEFGGGWYSTPLLHALADVTWREVYTVEDHPQFMDALKEVWGASWHHFIFDPSFAMPVQGPGLVFVDCGAIYRAPCVQAAQEAGTDIVVVHDTEDPPVGGRPSWGEPYPGMAEALSAFKYRVDFDRFAERTTVVSDTIPLALDRGSRETV